MFRGESDAMCDTFVLLFFTFLVVLESWFVRGIMESFYQEK